MGVGQMEATFRTESIELEGSFVALVAIAVATVIFGAIALVL